jgi:hypothetical protein
MICCLPISFILLLLFIALAPYKKLSARAYFARVAPRALDFALLLAASGSKFPKHTSASALLIFFGLEVKDFGLDLPDFGDYARFRRLPDSSVSRHNL